MPQEARECPNKEELFDPSPAAKLARRGTLSWPTHASTSNGVGHYTENLSISENRERTQADRGLKPTQNTVGVCAASSGVLEDRGELGLDHSMDLEKFIDYDAQYVVDVGLPPPLTTPSPQDSSSSSSQMHLSELGPYMNFGTSNIKRASDLFMAVSLGAEINKMKITELASKAMEELTKLALAREPLWQLDMESNTEVLSGIEYMREFGHITATLMEIVRMVEVGESPSDLPNLDNITHSGQFSMGSGYNTPMFPKALGPKPVSAEASREIDYVKMKAASIVELMMNLKKWSMVFSNIVSRASVVGLLSPGVEGNYDGALQVMTAEFHAPTPLVPTRESYFARYCKQLDIGMWGVVDVSLEKLFQFPSRSFRRQPSGCLIQEMPNGCCKVIWVEHAEVDNRLVRNIFEPLLSSGFVFSAKRWVGTLLRHLEWQANLMAGSALIVDGVLISQAGRRSLLKLSERMMRSFLIDMSASTENKWMALGVAGGEDIRVTTKSSNIIDDPGKPPGPRLVFATSIHLPATRNQVFTFLRDGNSRYQWDILSFGNQVEEATYIINGDNPGNRVSIVKVINGETRNIEILYLQESYTDSTGSYVVYAPIDVYAMSGILAGGNPEEVSTLPSGFAILPDRPMYHDQNGGSLLTLGFHITDQNAQTPQQYIPPQSLQIIHNIVTATDISIREAIACIQ